MLSIASSLAPRDAIYIRKSSLIYSFNKCPKKIIENSSLKINRFMHLYLIKKPVKKYRNIE